MALQQLCLRDGMAAMASPVLVTATIAALGWAEGSPHMVANFLNMSAELKTFT